jgi:hypothetical protein
MPVGRRVRTAARTILDGLGDRWPGLGSWLDRQRAATFDRWTDGFNGQRERQRMVKELVQRTGVDAFVETGTYHGATAAHVRRVFGLPVWTVETTPRSHALCRWRFRGDEAVRLYNDDSRAFLRTIAGELSSHRCLFYLDAHWYDDLPLADELRIIDETWEEFVVIIDDFKVDDDPKYYFDDYGPGRALEYAYLPRELLRTCAAFWPKASGMEESYPWRGCIVLGRGRAVVEGLVSCATLRPVSD